jgi:hypothetical protein
LSCVVGLLGTATVTFVHPAGTDAGAGPGAGPDKPNIFLIIGDEIGAESISLYPDLVGDSGAALDSEYRSSGRRGTAPEPRGTSHFGDSVNRSALLSGPESFWIT